MLAASAIEIIGGTPLIALDRIYTGPGRIIAKAEFLLPGGSVKDRAAKAILLAAREDGRLKPGMPVVEMTSGNMGAGLAVACAALGHPLVVTMSAGNSPARAKMLEGLGAEVVLIAQVDGSPGQVTGSDVNAAAQAACAIARARDGFYVDQFNAAEGIAAHEAVVTAPDGARREKCAATARAARFVPSRTAGTRRNAAKLVGERARLGTFRAILSNCE